jgi:protein-tyrosine-phosphatase
MAEAFFNKLAPKGWLAVSAGAKPAESIDPKSIKVMREVGIDINGQKPRLLTEDMIEKASKIVSMGCGGDICPAAFRETENWGIEDPSGKPIEKFRGVRDIIKEKVEHLVKEID